MPTLPTKVLAIGVFVTLGYALSVHFPPADQPTTTNSEQTTSEKPAQKLPPRFQKNRRWSICAFIIAYPTIIWNTISNTAPGFIPLDRIVDKLALIVLAAGHLLFCWSAITTKPGRLKLMYSPTKMKHVVDTGPFAWVRHPTYVAYSLFFIGIWLAVASVCGACYATVFDVGRLVLLTACVVSIISGYHRAMILEEDWFLNGKDIDGEVREAYVDYVKRVKSRWIPGVM